MSQLTQSEDLAVLYANDQVPTRNLDQRAMRSTCSDAIGRAAQQLTVTDTRNRARVLSVIKRMTS